MPGLGAEPTYVTVQLRLSDWERDRSGTQSIDTSQGRIDSRKNKVAEAGQVKLVQLYKTRSIQQAVWRCQTGQISQDVKTWGTLRHASPPPAPPQSLLHAP